MPRLRLVLLVLAVAACQAAPPPPPPFDAVADVKQLMANILEPAADVYWDAVGSVVDAKGTKEFAPTTPEAWTAVRNSAFVIAESGNLLMLAPRARDSAEWMIYSKAMTATARRAIAAAESRNPTAVFDVGAEVYDTCVQCHSKYAVAQVRPNAAKP